jgi:hypothetical protein
MTRINSSRLPDKAVICSRAPVGEFSLTMGPTYSRGEAIPGTLDGVPDTGDHPYHLAQLNIARALAPLTSPQLADFVAALDPVNALADRAPGFVWRLQTEDGDATGIQAFGDELIIVNLTVWESLEALRSFVYNGRHADVLRRRRDWFEVAAEATAVAWWVPRDTLPTVDEAIARLATLRSNGPSEPAFTLQRPFPAPAGPLDATLA